MNSETLSPDIAIIGMSAMFPGARNLREYWQNILNKVDAVQDAPDEIASPYFDPNSSENDRIYTRKGGFLGDLAEFNPVEFGIMPNSVDGGEPDHFLALKLAHEVLKDAGYIDRPFNREKAGIILGRGTYINRGYNTLLQHGQIVDQTLDLLRQLNPGLDEETLATIRKELKASLPPFTAEMAPGLVPNVITGRIANRLDLMGPNYIVDAACASSLIAVELAIKELVSGRCDMVLAGGVHASTPPQINMIFCQLGALARGKIRPFDKSANGTLLGEGLGILALKRLADAEKDGDRIYAVLKGTGSSSDGKALGLLAPRIEGEVLALKRAYEENGIDPKTVDLIEAHGTGIALGDRTEVQSLTQIFGSRQGHLPRCAIGSVKSMIGHCIPAAGVAGIIKSALALYHKILPPTICDEVNPNIEIEKTPFYINTQPRPWIHGGSSIPRRAGVNAFGFGGINAHAVLEEYTGSQTTNPIETQPVLHQQWPTELLLFSGNSRTAIINLINDVQQVLEVNPNISLANLAYTLKSREEGTHRLAIVAKDIPDLQRKLNVALEKLKDSSKTKLQTRTGIYYAQTGSTKPGKTAFLFPGEGGQYPNMLADLCLYFPSVRKWFDRLDETFASSREQLPSSLIFPPPTSLTEEERNLAKKQLFNMDVASEIVFTASMALYELLKDLGIQCDVMVGHSTGENTALIASGTVRLAHQTQLMEKMRLLNQIYRDLEATDRIPKGALLTVGAVEPSVLRQIIDSSAGRLHLAMNNCPNQVVLFGSESDIEEAATQLKAAGAICVPLPFDRAYHTPLFEEVGTAFRAFYDALDVDAGQTPLYSCATAEAFPTEPEAIRALAAKQWSSRVCFRETVEKLYSEDVKTFIEVGPSGNLTAFVDDILHGREYLALASNIQRQSGLEQIQHLLGRLFVNGMAVDSSALYRQRELTEVSLDAKIAPGKGSRKPSPVLSLAMPIMRLEPDFVRQIQDKLQTHSPSQPEVVISAVTPQVPVANGSHRLISEQEVTVANTVYLNTSEQEVAVPTTAYSYTSEQEVITTNNLSPYAIEQEVIWETVVPDDQPEYLVENLSPSPISTDPFPVDSRLSILSAHFELMDDFLASQGRTIAALFGSGQATSNSDGNGFAPVSFFQPPLTHEEAWPFLGQIVEIDSQHLQSDRSFDMEGDIFLYDHTLGSTVSQHHPELFPLPVIPFTISMETLAEAAAYLLGGDKAVVGLYDMRGYRWLALDRGQLSLSIVAQVKPQPAEHFWDVHVQLFQSGITEVGDRHLVFEGDVRLSDQFSPAPNPLDFYLAQSAPSRWSDEDLYRTGMFHGPRFRGVKHIRRWGKEGIEADLEVIPTDNFFTDVQQSVFQLDAGLLDAAGQLVGYWVSEQFGTDFNVFPFQVRAFHQYEAPLPPNSLVLCRGLMRFTSELQTEASFDFLDESGRVIARLEGWCDRYFSVPHKYYQCRLHPQTAFLSEAWMQAETGLVCRRIEPFPNHFLDDGWSIWKRVLAHLMLSEQERNFWYELPEKGPRRTDWLLGRIAAKDALRQWAKQTFNLELAPIDIEILPTQLGKPIVRCPELEAIAAIPDISISHSRGYIVAVLASPNKHIGIDIERLNHVRSEDLLNAAFTTQELQLLPGTQAPGTIVGLWCAKEATAKAVGTGLQGIPSQWCITHYSTDRQQVTITHRGQAFEVKLWHQDNEVLAICQY